MTTPANPTADEKPGNTPANPANPNPGAPPSGDPVELVPAAAAAPAIDDGEVIETGDPGLDLALDFFRKAGVGKDHPALKHARETGKFDLLRATLKEKGDAAKGFEKYVEVAEAAAERERSSQQAARNKARQIVFDAAGGEAKWAEIKAWAEKKADPGELQEINAAIRAGGIAAAKTVEWLRGLYDQEKGNGGANGAPKSALKEGAARGESSPDGGPLSPEQYRAAVREAQRKGARGAELDALAARRRAWRG